MLYQQLRENMNQAVDLYQDWPVDAPCDAVADYLHSFDIPLQSSEDDLKELYVTLTQQALLFRSQKVCRLQVRDFVEADIAGNFLATLFPDPPRVLLGIMELLINAIEHGNLGITFEEKARLINENRWAEETSRRLQMPENIHKRVLIICREKGNAVEIEITDHGHGFQWTSYIDLQHTDIRSKNGRGVAYANLISFDELNFNHVGNTVVGTMYKGHLY